MEYNLNLPQFCHVSNGSLADKLRTCLLAYGAAEALRHRTAGVVLAIHAGIAG